MIEYTIASLTDLTGILDLQSRNHAVQLSREQIEKEGFVTLHHSEQLLKKMNSPFPHIIAKDGVQVVGYALVLHKDLKEEVTGLTDMFEQLKSIKNLVAQYSIIVSLLWAKSALTRNTESKEYLKVYIAKCQNE